MWELDPADPRVVAYERETTKWQIRQPGPATIAEIQAAWTRIAKGLGLRARRFRGGPTDEQIGRPAPIAPEHLREWTAKQFSRLKRRLRSAEPVPWDFSDGHRELHPLSRPKPWPGGRPRRPTFTDEALRAELAKQPRPTHYALALHFKVTVRHIGRRIKRLSSR